ncbi:MAG: hypothetical protein NZZ41_05375 [Candidatus Dojkabacteria bacterium]|nr:hypothetical protein [Candidatus Dojkabacteria bacterium]
MIYKKFIKNYISSILLRETYQNLPDYEFIKNHHDTYGKKAYIRFVERKPLSIKTLFRNLENEYHNDPSGIYAFPASYVLKHYHNQNLNIFFSRRYIISLVDKSKNKFIVSESKTLGEWKEIFNRMGLSLEKQIEFFEIAFKSFYSPPFLKKLEFIKDCIQNNRYDQEVSPHVLFQASQIEYATDETDYKLYIGEKQRFLWLKAGIDALEDLGKGVIHRDEPEQIIFLKEDACEMIDVLDREKSLGTPSRNFEKDLEKKVFQKGLFYTDKEAFEFISFQKYLERDLAKIFGLIFQRVLKDKILERVQVQIKDVEYRSGMAEYILEFSAFMKGEKYTVRIPDGKSVGKSMYQLSGTIQILDTKTQEVLYQRRTIMSGGDTGYDIVEKIRKGFLEKEENEEL